MSEHVRIRFDLSKKDEDGWPPTDAEWLWASPEGADRYRLDNSPVYARGVSSQDVVRAAPNGEHLDYLRVIEPGGHSTYRVYLQRSPSLKAPEYGHLWPLLEAEGCSFEGFDGGPLYAIDVPPVANISAVYDVLERGERSSLWDFEEGNFGHQGFVKG